MSQPTDLKLYEKVAKQIKNILEKDFSEKLKIAKQELIWEKQEADLLSIFRNIK